MTRYFFDTADGDQDADERGVELPGLDVAAVEAVRYAGSLLRDDPTMLKPGEDVYVTVRTDQGPVAKVQVSLTLL